MAEDNLFDEMTRKVLLGSTTCSSHGFWVELHSSSHLPTFMEPLLFFNFQFIK